jgi:all-trans-8'-apo-beta-carotenal 15,15'-oxygenase
MQTEAPWVGECPYNCHDWQKGYRSLLREFDYEIEELDGQIPTDLQGTLFRNGPGLFEIGGQHYRHPFDGDGMICAIAFQHGRAHFRNRFVRTAGYVAEQKAQRILYRSMFGTQKPGGMLANAFDLRRKNLANTNVIYWGEKLLALWEAAEPYRLDPATLETLGLEFLDDVLKPGDAFGAHPRVDSACELNGGTPCLVGFAVSPGFPTSLRVFEFNVQGHILRQQTQTLPGFAFMHDFAITPHYCLFFQNPVKLNLVPWILGLKSAGESLQFNSQQPTQIVVVSRQNDRPLQTIPVEAGFVFHHANAFEDGDEVVVDSIAYATMPSMGLDFRNVDFDFEVLPPGIVWRFRCNLETGEATHEQLDERCVEFPVINPAYTGRPYRYLYLGAAHLPQGNAPLQAVVKMDLETGNRQLWSAAPYGYTTESTFVPRPGAIAEDDGWLLVMVFDSIREVSKLVILDAQDLHREAIATLWLKHHIPYGLHGSFTPVCFA